MGLLSKLLKKKTGTPAKSVEEFVSLIRVYYQAVMAVDLGITNLNMLPDMALFKRMLKISTQGNKPGMAEKSRVRKILIQDYGLKDSFFKEIDASIRKNCRHQQSIQPYLFQFQGFCSDLFSMLENLMTWKFRFSLLAKRWLYITTKRTIHDLLTRSEWKEVKLQKAAWSIRKYAESLNYSEQWITDFVYHVVLLARNNAARPGR